MSNNVSSALNAFSSAVPDLISRAAAGVVAVKGAPYRVSSGVAISENLVAVAHHTLRRTDTVPIQTADGAQASASVLGRDGSLDLAFLRVEGAKLTPLPHADPAQLRAGSLVAVVGMTADVGPSASLGILGAVGGPRRTWRGGQLDQFLRLDVNLYPSQSGAAVVDASGALIGLATPGLLRHSALAVPIETITRIGQEISERGRVRRGFIGVGVQPVEIPERLRAQVENSPTVGLMVLSIEQNSPAEGAGVQLGDILLMLDGNMLAGIEDLQDALRGDAVGRSAKLLLIRGGAVVQTAIAIGERGKPSE